MQNQRTRIQALEHLRRLRGGKGHAAALVADHSFHQCRSQVRESSQ